MPELRARRDLSPGTVSLPSTITAPLTCAERLDRARDYVMLMRELRAGARRDRDGVLPPPG